jgi:hypothetical protein
MKRAVFAILSLLILAISCTEETPRAELLEYRIGTKLYSNKGYAYKYSDYKQNIKEGFDWHIYNLGQTSLYMQAYDSTFEETMFYVPDIEATLTVELPDGNSKLYRAVSGDFRIIGQEMGDVLGDFHLKMKNIENPLDSLLITDGFFRIWLLRYDRVF